MKILYKKTCELIGWFLLLAVSMGGCGNHKEKLSEPKVLFSWHSGAMYALVPINALVHAGIAKLDRPDFVHYGTSSGAIVAALLAAGHSTTEIKQFFENNAAQAFGFDKIVNGALGNTEDAALVLKTKLQEILGTKKLADLPNLHIFAAKGDRAIELSQQEGYGHFLVADAVMASASIPQIFGKHEINGQEYFDAGTLKKNPLNDPSLKAMAKKGPKDKVFSLANGFSAPEEPADPNFTLLKGPSPAEAKVELDTIEVDTSTIDILAKDLAKAAGFPIPPLLSAQDLFGTHAAAAAKLKITPPLFYSALSNADALKAFERLGIKMAQKNEPALKEIASLIAK